MLNQSICITSKNKIFAILQVLCFYNCLLKFLKIMVAWLREIDSVFRNSIDNIIFSDENINIKYCVLSYEFFSSFNCNVFLSLWRIKKNVPMKIFLICLTYILCKKNLLKNIFNCFSFTHIKLKIILKCRLCYLLHISL